MNPSRLALALGALLALTGCHARLRQVLPRVEAVRPVVWTEQGELGLEALPPPWGGADPTVAPTPHQALLQGLAEDLAALGPLPPDPAAPWTLVIQVRGWGMDQTLGADPGDLFLHLRLQLLSPEGDRVYRHDATCRAPLAEALGSVEEAQRLRVAEVVRLSEEPGLQKAFPALAQSCGAWMAELMRLHASP